MKYRVLGRTGLKVSELGFGGWAIGGNKFGNSYGATDDKESIKAIKTAIELGCNFFDTADIYGHGKSEELLGKVTAKNRDNYIIATKVGGDFYSGGLRMNFHPNYINYAYEQSCKRLNTDYIDIYQLHNPSLEDIKKGQIFEVLQRLKEAGKIRFIGLCIDDDIEGLDALKFNIVDTIQVVYNIFEQAPKEELFTFTDNANVGIIAREPLANGLLTGLYNENTYFPPGDFRHGWPVSFIRSRAQATQNLRVLLNQDVNSFVKLSLKFALSSNSVGTVIPGCKTAEHTLENLSVSDIRDLTIDELEKINYMYERRFGV